MPLLAAVRRHPLVTGLVAAAAAAAVVGGVLVAVSAHGPPRGTALRALAAPTGVRIGTAIDAGALAGNARYAAVAAAQFDAVTPENAMKWDAIEPQRGREDYTAADALVRFAGAHGQRVRGHALVWYRQLPQWVRAAGPTLTRRQAEDLLRRHVMNEVSHFRGRVWQWDVVNEALAADGALRDDLWLRTIGPDYVADAFRWAHEADPDALLFYNDYDIEYPGAKQDAAFALVQRLRREGVPIDGVGFQTHLDVRFGLPDMATTMTRFARLGVRTAETEVDVRTELPATAEQRSAQQAGYVQTLQACLLVPACISYTVWGFTDAYSWVPANYPGQGAADLYDARFVPKPAYRGLQGLLTTAQGVPARG